MAVRQPSDASERSSGPKRRRSADDHAGLWSCKRRQTTFVFSTGRDEPRYPHSCAGYTPASHLSVSGRHDGNSKGKYNNRSPRKVCWHQAPPCKQRMIYKQPFWQRKKRQLNSALESGQSVGPDWCDFTPQGPANSTSSTPGGFRTQGKAPTQRQLQRHASSSRCAVKCGACIARTCRRKWKR